jgi:hypothetical protein
VPATPDLLKQFYGSIPARTSQTVVAVKDDRVIGVAGVYVDDARLIVFTDLSDELRQDKRTMVRGIREIFRLVQKYDLPVYAVVNTSIDGAVKLLTHVGFVHEYEGVYAWQR